MQHSNCGCALLALRTLARVEELTTSSQMPLEAALQVTSAAERPSLAVLSCERCRQHRLPLTAVTILCTHLVDWLCRVWNLDQENATASSKDATRMATPPATSTTTTAPTINSSNSTEDQSAIRHTTHSSNRPWKFSLGTYDVAADEADALSNELMILRLTGLSAVLDSLEAALVSSGPCLPNPASPDGGANGTTSNNAAFAPAYLELVRANIRLVRACVHRLKSHSLLNSNTASALVQQKPSIQANTIAKNGTL